MYGQPGAYAPPPGPPRPGRREAIAWLASATLVVLAAVVIIEIILTRGSGGTPHASGSNTPTTHTTSTGSAPSTPTGGPTTDVLPTNAESSLCSSDVGPQFVAVAVVTTVSGVRGGKPDVVAKGTLADCASAAVRSRISELYGTKFGTDYSSDLTGGDNSGPTAAYSVSAVSGSSTLRLDLTRQHDGHYEVTDFTYG